ncbi:protein mono-ADP-ribosyltransferase PARP3-like [Diadema antillarum]|uniref:protein mono-ADP-ribosyltransferase PARP3-like n=1 Tax=Diadema antillarum TaxID=105358 RepID=UPI003A84F9CB
MPPKKRGASTKAAAGKAKKGKQDTPDDGGLKAAVEKLKAADKGKHKVCTVDSHCHMSGAEVYQDYDCMLNQTNIGQNNNKYYIIQLLLTGWNNYHVWTRWGRVGEPGQNALNSCGSDLEAAKKAFSKKFSDKTKNKWDDRENFQPHPGKYTLIEVEEADAEELQETSEKLANLDDDSDKKVLPSQLEKPTQELVKLIFNEDMFKEQMTKFEIDVKKMPLGKLSKAQIAKGFEALEEIEKAVQGKTSKAQLSQLSSKFYTIIPHSFGRKVPPVIDDAEKIQAKKDMLLVLGDIELTLTMQREKKAKEKVEAAGDAVPNPLDVKYGLLKCTLELVDESSREFKLIKTYISNTGSPAVAKQLLHVWKMDREDEGGRFSAHKNITNRRLLWHGTNVAVVAAILKTGLRIMPHSGGRVGRGIYFASEHAKSHGYTGSTNDGKTVMFLNEVALGKEHYIQANNSSLTQAPKGSDCVIAKGQQEPDPSKDEKLVIDGNKVAVPQGKPVRQSKYSSSHFYQSEYLIYKESQNRMRYLCLFKFW